MNVLSINNSDINGGAARVAYEIKDWLVKNNHRTSLFVKHKYSRDENVFLTRWPNLFTRFFKKITGKDLGSILSEKLHRFLATDLEWFNTDKILQTRECKTADLIHCHNLHGNYFKLDTLRKLAVEKPVVWTFHDMWPVTSHCGHAFGGALKNGFFQCPGLDTYQELLWNNEAHLEAVKKRVYANAKFHIVVPCLWLQEKVKQSILSDHPITIIYNGIDENIFQPSEKKVARRTLGLPLDKKIVLFASARGASDEKGGAYFKETAARFSDEKNILFLCLGDGESPSSTDNNVRCVPFVSSQEMMAKYYSAADVLLFPSLAETFPLVVLEALSCGLPVVSFDVGGVKEAVCHKKEGYIAAYRDSDDLANGLRFVLSLSPEIYASMSRAARTRVLERFTEKHMCDTYFALYEKVISQWDLRNQPYTCHK
ncbi:glycosyltransferase [Patescibacteria group bacterium]|nr:glycosyltransferase [Patescibacteria group bacterium]